MAKKMVLSLGLALAFGFSSCGGSDSGGALGDAVSAALKESASAPDSPIKVDDKMIGCIKDSVLGDDARREKLQTALDGGAKGEDLLNAAGDAESDSDMTKMMLGCFSSTQMVDMMVTEMVDSANATDENKKCLADEFDKIDKDELVDGLMGLASEQKGSPGATKITAAAITCFGIDAFGS